MPFVLDACAIIALISTEPGSDTVARIIEFEDCRIHPINVFEIYKDSLRRTQSFETAEAILASLTDAGLQVENLMDDSVLRRVASIKIEAGNRLAIPDAFGVATAERLGGLFLTADHKELDDLLARGYPIQFFR